MWFAIAAAALMVVGAIQKSQAEKAAGKAELLAAQYENTLAGRRAEAMDQQAGQVRAASQRAAIEDRRQAQLAESRARAVAGASGAGVSDVSVVKAIGDIGYEGELRALTSIYQGEESARGLEYGAELERARGRGILYGGQVAKEFSKQRANQTLLSGASSAAGSFAGGFG